GQKRMFLKHFSQILNDNIDGNGEGWTIVDVFGGSGLLSHTAKPIFRLEKFYILSIINNSTELNAI
ncbi:s-adenosyl-L-methionine-dependent methyltransferase, partial [Glaesserella parasuis]